MQENNKISDVELKHKIYKINNDIKLKKQKECGFKDEFLEKFEKKVIKKEIAVLEKALELACERIVEVDKNKCKVCYMLGDGCLGYKPMCHKYIETNFKTKAKEMMKSE